MIIRFKYQNEVIEIEVIFKKIKHTYMRVKDGHVVITTHLSTTEKQIEKLMIRHFEKIKKMLKENAIRSLIPTSLFIFGRKYAIEFRQSLTQEIIIDKNTALINTPKIEYSIIEKIINNFYVEVIGKYLENNFERFMLKFQNEIARPTFYVKTMKTRYGSCNYVNHKISINSILAKYEKKYLDYVVYHELCHLKYPNHSKEYYKYLEEKCPNFRSLRKNLKQFTY